MNEVKVGRRFKTTNKDVWFIKRQFDGDDTWVCLCEVTGRERWFYTDEIVGNLV